MQTVQTIPPRGLKTGALLCALALLLGAGLRPGEATAAEPRFTAAELTVKDEATGLVWTRDANIAGRPLSWSDAYELVRMLNQENHGGHADWRLPELNELEKLATSSPNPAYPAQSGQIVANGLNNAGFLNIQPADYWSGTTSTVNYADALFINMAGGEVSAGSKALYRSVWPVRWEGRAGSSTQQADSELTIKDKTTGLIWTRNANLAGRALSWNDARDMIKTLNQENYAGHADWSLPGFTALKKLAAAARGRARDNQTIVDGLDNTGFQNVQTGDYWSGTTSMYNTAEALLVNTTTGRSAAGDKTLYGHVWPVRWDALPRADSSKKR